MKSILLPFLPLLLPAVAQAAPQGSQAEEAWWGNWRGPRGTSVAPRGNPPTEWSEEKNIRWKVTTPGLGSSSPIVWEDRIYLTTAIETDEEPNGSVARPTAFARYGTTSAPTRLHEFAVLALTARHPD